MPKCDHLLLYFLFFSASFLTNVFTGNGQTCNLDILISRHQPVGEVILDKSFDESALKTGKNLTTIKGALPLTKGLPFTKSDFEAALAIIQREFNSFTINASGGFRRQYPSAEIKNCQNSAATQIDIVFHLYDFNFENYNSKDGSEQITRKTSPNKFTKFFKPISPQPYIGFDSDRNIIVGSSFSVDLKNSVFQRASVDVEGSSSGNVEAAGFDGNYKFKNSRLKDAEWSTGIRYSSLPADVLKIKKANFYGRASVSAPLMHFKDSKESFVIFGVAVEGGNRQTDLSILKLLPTTIEDSRYGSLKFYAGTDLSFTNQNLKISYGLQLANDGKGSNIDYTKQIFDSVYTARIPISLPLSLDARFNAGNIGLRSGKIPIPERFFGGSNKQNFISGSPWEIQSGPLIRSFPTNGLNRTGASVFIGGDSFVSTNLTLAATIWSKPLVPREIRTEILTQFNDADFINKLRTASEPVYIPQTPDYPVLVREVKFETLQSDVQKVADKMDYLAHRTLGKDAMDRVQSCLDLSEDATSILNSSKKSSDKTLEIRELVINSLDPALPPNAPGVVDRLLTVLSQVIETNDSEISSEKSNLVTLKTSLKSSFQLMKSKYETFTKSSTGLIQAQNDFDNDIKYMQGTIRTLTRDVNLFSISPALLFDAARLDSKSEVFRNGFRYGIGPALKFEFLGLNITTGYAFNSKRLPGERRGNFVFNFDVADLFK